MKLSIIVPIYKDASKLKRVLRKLEEQTTNKFEVIVITDTQVGNTLDIVDEYQPLFGKRLTVIFNSKRVGRTPALISGFKAAAGTYSLVLDATDKFNDKFVERAIANLKGKTAEIIEFKTDFRSPIRFEAKMRVKPSDKFDISDHPEIFAYGSFFDFNKFYRTSLMKRVTEMPRFSVNLNSRFSTEISYKALLSAKTYQSINVKLVSSNSVISPNYNPLKSIRQFKEIINYSNAHGYDLEQELKYAMFIHLSIFLFAFTGASKNKVLLKKLSELYKKEMETTFADFQDTNRYILKKNKETLILRRPHKPSELVKLYKEFK